MSTDTVELPEASISELAALAKPAANATVTRKLSKMPRAVVVKPVLVARSNLKVSQPGNIMRAKGTRLCFKMFKNEFNDSGNQGRRPYVYSMNLGISGFRTDDKSRCEPLLDGFTMEEFTKTVVESRANGQAYTCEAIPDELILVDDPNVIYAIPSNAPLPPEVGSVRVIAEPKRKAGRPAKAETDEIPNAPSDRRNGPNIMMPETMGSTFAHERAPV